MPKFEKSQVNYSRGHIDSHCGKVFHDDKGFCKHYIAHASGNFKMSGACQLVEGPINPVYWCKEFEKAK